MQTGCDIEFCRTRDIQFGRGRLLPELECKRLNSQGRQGCPWRPRLKLGYRSHLPPCDRTGCRDCDQTQVALHSPQLCAVLIMSNMGRYMATTMPPITMPITTIMIGSRMDVSAVTAASTSSS